MKNRDLIIVTQYSTQEDRWHTLAVDGGMVVVAKGCGDTPEASVSEACCDLDL